MFGGFTLRHRPCPDCGATVAATELDDHVCDPELRLEHQMLQERAGIAALEQDVASYLSSPHGRFELWDAERRRTHGR